ncbi:MAG: hypothetical protein IT542_07160 [Rubellimicrobium sp.]|nr:hypothetical protein [Rubellimicrobium sp.]
MSLDAPGMASGESDLGHAFQDGFISGDDYLVTVARCHCCDLPQGCADPATRSCDNADLLAELGRF